ncbi:MAG: putative replication-associated protein [Circoviridae sp.]|nr:MAG: putative replication-associated protein [Circoviridae sp.]
MSQLSKLSKDEQVGGNKQPQPKVSKFQCKNWVMTWNNYPKEHFELLSKELVPLCVKYSFYEEVGEQGTPHIQGAFMLKKKMRQDTIYKLIGHKFWMDKMKGRWDDQRYTAKGGGACLTNVVFKKERIIKIIDYVNLYPYQKYLADYFEGEPDDREMLWVFGTVNFGKTSLCKYLSHHFGAITVGGEDRHVLAQVMDASQEADIIVPLAYGDSMVSFSALEKIKDGYFSSHFGTKANGMVFRPHCHVLVMSNFPPDMSHRNFHPTKWKVFEIDGNMNLVPYIAPVDSESDDEMGDRLC